MNEIIEKLKAKLEKEESLKIKIKVVANAKQNAIEEYDEEIIKVKINKPAVDGKANKAIIEYLAEMLSVPKSNVIILKGEKNSIKDLRILAKSHII